MTRILGISGSLRAGSFNTALLRAAQQVAGDGIAFDAVTLHGIPLYDGDAEARDGLPAAVTTLKDRIVASDGVLLVTPEYNRSIPALLKNAIDWASRPYGQNSWGGKPVAIAGLAPGNVGTAAAQAHLRSVLTILGVKLMSQPEIYLTNSEGFFDASGRIASSATEEVLAGFMKKFSAWVAKCRG